MNKLTDLTFVRVVRTASSERYLIQENSNAETDIAAVDIHFIDNIVTATLLLLDEKYFVQELVDALIEKIDSTLLPMACLNDGDLSFTVVEAQVVGQFTNVSEA